MKTVLRILFTLCSSMPVKAQHQVEIWTWVYSYDYATSRYTKETRQYRTTEHYNNKGQLIETRRNFNKDLYDNTIFEYNDAGQKIREIDYRASLSGPRQFIIRDYIYNEQGLVESMVFRSRNKKDSTQTRELYTYEGTNMVKKIQKISPYNITETWTYTYKIVNGNKRVTEIYTLPGGREKKKRTKDYNEKGLLMLELGVGGYRTEYDYAYDMNGDWIKKKISIREGFFGPWTYSELRKNLLK